MKDWRGTPIELGCKIVYPVRFASSMDVREGIVKVMGMKPRYSWSSGSAEVPYLKVKVTASSDGDLGQTEWLRTLTVLDRITVVESPDSKAE